MPRLTRLFPRALVAVLAVAAVHGGLAPAGAEATGTIAGVAFEDLNRDGVMQAGERSFGGHRIYLYDGTGRYLAYRVTDASGRYSFGGLVDGSYRAEYAPQTWWELRDSLVPTTTGTVRPTQLVTLAGQAAVDFGWRPILVSTSLSAPLSETVTPAGARVASYNDAVTAGEVAEALAQGRLSGDEAVHTTVYFAYSGSSSCSSGVSQSGGVYTGFSVACYVTYASWLDDGDRTLFHEYGHAWGDYHAYMVRQDPTLASYLEARGLTGDSRLDTSHGWSRNEILAEDYRQLFGSANARQGGQMNLDIPLASSVAGLEEFLATTFRAPSPSGSDPAPPPPDEPPATVPEPTTARVADLDGLSAAQGKSLWRAQLDVLIRDDLGAPVAGADVSVSWSGAKGEGGTLRCLTGETGWCLVSATVKRTTPSIRAAVSGVSAAGLTYVAGHNADPDGDSDGTSLVIARA